MRIANLKQMIRGWFIGDFSPTLCETKEFEAAIKSFKLGEFEEPHYHAVATEYTVIINGKVRMNDKLYSSGDIIIIEPGEVTDFYCEETATIAVIKIPSVKNDKFVV